MMEEAEACVPATRSRNPKLADALNAMAQVHAERGDLAASCQASRAAIVACPAQAEAYWRLSSSLKGGLADDLVQTMQDLFLDPSLSINNKALLCFEDWRPSWNNEVFSTTPGNTWPPPTRFTRPLEPPRGLTCDPGIQTRLIDSTIATFTAEFLSRRALVGVLPIRGRSSSWACRDPERR